MVSRLVLGGRVPQLDKDYTIGAFFKVYLLSCCGLLAGKIKVFVDSHITFDMTKTLKGPDAGEMKELEALRNLGVMRVSSPPPPPLLHTRQSMR